MISMLGIREVAKLLGVGEQTVRSWEVSGKLIPAFKTPGGHRRYRIEDVERILSGGEYHEVIYDLMYDNYEALPDKITVTGSVFNEEEENGEGYIDLGNFYKKITSSIKLHKYMFRMPIVFRAENDFSSVGIKRCKESNADEHVFYKDIKSGRYLLFVQNFYTPQKRRTIKVDDRVLDGNLITKIPRFMFGEEIVQIDGEKSMTLRCVYYERGE